MCHLFLVSCPINKHTNARAIFSPDKLGTENDLAPRVERHRVASGVRTNPQGRQAFRVCPALLSTPWRLHIGYAYLSETTLVATLLNTVSVISEAGFFGEGRR